jgi:thiol-disulfide isomerase/thioredoxin
MVSCSAFVQAQVIDPSNTLVNPIATESMGRSLLVEEVTTTWCPTCAQIDPYLKGVADSHGSRIAMVAYHPSDGEDAFQPPAAQHRINRLGLHHGNAIPSPTFFVEGKNPRSGTEAWSDVQRDILDLELTRQDSTLLPFYCEHE